MNEEIRARIATLNAVWSRYAKTAEEQLDPVSAETLNYDFLSAWEGLNACGIEEWMLEYDPATLTFSLPETGPLTDDEMPIIAFATTGKLATVRRWRDDGPNTEKLPLI
ncbi:MAG TPA: hypothetical protein VF458_16000 [Ktedonobacteraceae bacterium]